MSDFHDTDDLLNCELLGDIDEHALIGDEDDLLMSDEEEESKTIDSKSPAQISVTKSKESENIHESKVLEINNEQKVVESVTDLKDESGIFINKVSSSKSETKSSVSNFETDKQLLKESKSQNNEVSSTNKEPVLELIHPPEGDYLNSQESSNLEELNYEPDCKEEEDEDSNRERTNIKQASERDELLMVSSPEKTHQRFIYGKRGRGRGSLFLLRTHSQNPRAPFNHHIINEANQQIPLQQHYPPNNMSKFPTEGPNPIVMPRQPYPARVDFTHLRPAGPNYIQQNPNEVILGPRMYQPRHTHPNGIMPPFNNAQPANIMRPIFRPSDPNQIRSRMPIRGQGPLHIGIHNTPNYGPQTLGSMPPHLIHQSGNMQHVNSTSNSSVLPRKVLINPNFKGGVEAATNQLMKDTQFIQTISSHVAHLQSDEELLRQQEEFIKKNQMQIDKRRYARSRSRSISRSRTRSRSRSRGRLRSRERSYSPPRRKDFYRERRGGGFRGVSGRNRRAGSREWDNANAKRRRSFTPERREKNREMEEEDDETKAYRLEIEKQKAMREKIMKDKEMRRRKAAEEKLHEEKQNEKEEPTKLKPIVVTESKIISLKKVKEKIENDSEINSNDNKIQHASNPSVKKPVNIENENSSQRPIKRSVPTVKILPDAKRSLTEHLKKDVIVSSSSSVTTVKSNAQSTTTATTAVVKPVQKKSTTVQTETVKKPIQPHSAKLDNFNDYDDELLEEDRLLASPTPSPSNTPEPIINDNDGDDQTINIQNDKHQNSDDEYHCKVTEELEKPKKIFMSSNRKVLLKPFQSDEQKVEVKSVAKKRVFDRLERPKLKVGVKESAKKRIQRIIE